MRKAVGLGILTIILSLVFFVPWVYAEDTGKGKAETYSINVKEGESTLIRTSHGKCILIDGGGLTDGIIVTDKLQQMKIKRLDLVVVTRPYVKNVGGLIAVAENIPISQVIYNGLDYASETNNNFKEVLAQKEIPVNTPSTGVSIPVDDGVEIEYFTADTNKDLDKFSLSYRLFDKSSAIIKKWGKHIIINLSKHMLEFYSNGQLIKEYKIAIGKSSTPTPIGNYSVVNKIKHPPKACFGVRWLGFYPTGWPAYGIHGTDVPSSIGKSSSHGCIRLNNKDVLELYSLVDVGTPITIIR